MYRTIATDTIAIGAEDYDLKLFEHQYPLADGITYNSYLIADGGVTAVIDGVDDRCADLWLDNIDGPEKRRVDYLVVQHAEPDHSSSITRFLDRHPEARIVATPQALAIIDRFFSLSGRRPEPIAVKSGDTLDIGRHTLRFTTAPMVHWPDVMTTYDTLTKTLFTADAFGSFGVSGRVSALWPDEARRYYTNIVGKYGPQVQRLLAAVKTLGEVSLIAPLHGPTLEGREISAALGLYDRWSRYEPEQPEGVLIAYATIYGNTARAARECAAMLARRGADVELIDLSERDVSQAVAAAFRMGKILLAAPTYDAGLFPAMHDFLYHLQIKGLRDRTFGIIENGSWAPAAGRVMRDMASRLPGACVLEPTVTIKSALATDTVAQLSDLVTSLLAAR